MSIKRTSVRTLTRRVAAIGSLAGVLFCQHVYGQDEHTQKLADFQSAAYLTGLASHPKTGELLYTETWDDKPGGPSATVRYWAPDGAAIAYKTLDFSDSDFAPSVRQADFRHRRGFEVSRDGDELMVRKLKLAAAAPLESPSAGRATAVEYGDNLVVDAGFDRYVQARWERLIAGRTVRFDFLQIDKARVIPLKLKMKKCAAQFDVVVRCFSLNIDNLLLSRFVKPILLTYDVTQRRLLRYNGLGQLAGRDGKGLVVQIDYRYRD
jgi:hypothetical protein